MVQLAARFVAVVVLAVTAAVSAHAHDGGASVALSNEQLIAQSHKVNQTADADPDRLHVQPPVFQLDAASSGNNTSTTPTGKNHSAGAVPLVAKPEEPSYHPVIALILVTMVLCVSNSVADDVTGAVATTGILVSIYTLVLGVDLIEGIALAIVTTTGTGLATFVETVRVAARTPSPKTVIDWDLLLVVQPTLLLGVLIGVYVRDILPPWLLSTVIATLLLVCGSLLLQASHRRPDEHVGWSINEGSSLLDKPSLTPDTPAFGDAIQQVPLHKLGVLVSVVFAVVVLQVALAVAVPVVLLGYLAYKSYKTTMDTFERQQLPRVSPGEGEIRWTLHVVKTLPLASTLGGLLTGVFGLGSDIVIAPFAVKAGLGNTVASSTGPTIVLLSGLLAALEGMIQGGVSATLLLVVLLLASAVKIWGDEVMTRVLPAYLRGESLMLFAFAIMTLFGGIALAIAVA